MQENLNKSQILDSTRDIVMTELLIRLTAIERLLLSKKVIEEEDLIQSVNDCLDDLALSINNNLNGNDVLINFLKNRKK